MSFIYLRPCTRVVLSTYIYILWTIYCCVLVFSTRCCLQSIPPPLTGIDKHEKNNHQNNWYDDDYTRSFSVRHHRDCLLLTTPTPLTRAWSAIEQPPTPTPLTWAWSAIEQPTQPILQLDPVGRMICSLRHKMIRGRSVGWG